MILSRRKRYVPVNIPIYDKSVSISKINGFLLSVWVLVFGIIAVNYLGGFQTILTRPGQFFGHGATMFLVLVHVGRLQLLDKISRVQKINMIDILLFGSIVIFQLFNGRGWALFFLFQLLILMNYCRREVSRRIIIGGVAIFLFVAIVFGTYRQFSGIIEEIELSNLQYAYKKYTGADNAIDWFYSTALEGSAGLAGILTYSDNQGGIAHDFGISNLSFFLKLIPYPVRLDPSLPFIEIENDIKNTYPYNESITRSGYESFYAHFGVIGVLGLGILFGLLVCKFHNKMLKPGHNKLIIALLSAYILLPLYGNLHFVFFYFMTEACGLFAYRTIRLISKTIAMSALGRKSTLGI